MPKEITHWTLAEKAYKRIDADSPLKNIIRHHKNLYLAGAVLPDTPFYRLYGKEGKLMNELGRQLHDAPVDSYEPVKRVFRTHERGLPDDVLSLMLGFLAHIHGDSAFHPFVYYFSGNNMQGNGKDRDRAGIIHHTLEAYLDICYTEKFRLQNKGLFSEVLKNMEMADARFLNVLSVLFSQGQGTDISCVRRTLRLHEMVQALLDNDVLKIVLDMLDRVPGIDLELCRSSFYPLHKPDPDAILCHPFLYRHPVTGETFWHTLADLEDMTIQNTLAVFDVIESHVGKDSLAQAFSEQRGPNLCTGMVGKRAAEMRYFGAKNILFDKGVLK